MAYGALFSDDVLEFNMLLIVVVVFVRYSSCDIEIELDVVFTGRLQHTLNSNRLLKVFFY